MREGGGGYINKKEREGVIEMSQGRIKHPEEKEVSTHKETWDIHSDKEI